jgi:hypothetical protein
MVIRLGLENGASSVESITTALRAELSFVAIEDLLCIECIGLGNRARRMTLNVL